MISDNTQDAISDLATNAVINNLLSSGTFFRLIAINNGGNNRHTVTITLGSNDGSGLIQLCSNSGDRLLYQFDRDGGDFINNTNNKFSASHNKDNYTITITAQGSWLRGFAIGLFINSLVIS